jgi:hypothetical protein
VSEHAEHAEHAEQAQAPADEATDPTVADPRIADAIERLERLAERPPAEHVEVYEDVHRVLQESLAEAQDQQGRDGPHGGATP